MRECRCRHTDLLQACVVAVRRQVQARLRDRQCRTSRRTLRERLARAIGAGGLAAAADGAAITVQHPRFAAFAPASLADADRSHTTLCVKVPRLAPAPQTDRQP
jgi:hypothetical protein